MAEGPPLHATSPSLFSWHLSHHTDFQIKAKYQKIWQMDGNSATTVVASCSDCVSLRRSNKHILATLKNKLGKTTWRWDSPEYFWFTKTDILMFRLLQLMVQIFLHISAQILVHNKNCRKRKCHNLHIFSKQRCKHMELSKITNQLSVFCLFYLFLFRI